MSPASDIGYQDGNRAVDRTTYIIAATTLPLIFAYVAVLLRFLARRSAAVRIRADDYLVLIGLILTTVLAANTYAGIKLGLGKRSINSNNLVSLAKTLIASQILYAPAITTIKLSLVFLYYRIFLHKLKISLILISTILFLWSSIYILVTGLQCRPLSSVWDQNLVGRCIDTKAFFTAMGALNVVTGVFLLALALWMLKGLETSRVQKLLISCVLSTGAVVCILGSGRVFYVSHSSSDDRNYTEIKATVWSLAECSIAIVTVCLPTLGVFFRRKGSMQLRSKENHQTEGIEARQLESQDDAVPLQILRTVDWEICQETQAEIDRKHEESMERKMDVELKENGRQRDVIMMMASTNN